MNLADFSLRNRTTTLVLTMVLLGAGIVSFGGLARLEDPEFTIKEALVITPYPGATAAEVEQEVSDKIEQAVHQLGPGLDRLRQRRLPGRGDCQWRGASHRRVGRSGGSLPLPSAQPALPG